MLVPRITRGHLVLAGWLVAQGIALAAPATVRDLHRNEHAARQQRFTADLQGVIATCEKRGLTDPVERLRQLALPFDQQAADVDDLPSEVQTELSPALPADELEWRAALRRLQKQYAADLYLLSRKVLRDGSPTEAFHLVREAAFHDPDHPVARKLLGYVRYQDRWTTPYEALMLRKGYVRHETYGWLLKTHVARYEQGERYYSGQWMSADKEAAQRADLRYAWQVESDHFLVKTNHSLERGVELSVALEEFHRFFVREFAALFNTPQQMQALFDDGKPGGATPAAKHEVWYLRTREEFVRLLSKKQPGAETFNGVYLPSDRIAYFFAGPAGVEQNLETMFHEVTHQLLSESVGRPFEVAAASDFWVVEGIACYIESYRRDPYGRVGVGDPSHIRVRGAQERITLDGWYIPLDAFTAMGMREFQSGQGDFPTLQKFYSQATGLTHFFLHYQDGFYRDRFIQYLGRLYSPDKRVRLNPERLDRVLEVPFETLDRQYREYIAGLGEG